MTDKPTNWRALCAELADALHGHTSLYRGHECELVTRARAALAQPEPVGVTDEELLCIDDLRNAWNAQADAANSWDELGIDEIVWFAQQQALTRWGHPTIEPVPVAERLPGAEGLTDEELKQLAWKVHADAQDDDQCGDVVVRVCRAAIAADRAHYARPATH